MGSIQQTVQGRMAPGIEGAWAIDESREILMLPVPVV